MKTNQHFWFQDKFLKTKPQRIISLVPSQTELLYSLGLDKEVVGITKFCLYPTHWRPKKTIVGGTKSIHIETIKALSPDLIIGNKEENTKEMMEQLSDIAPIFISNIFTLEDAYSMIQSIGKITDKSRKAKELVLQIQESFATLISFEKPVIKTAYFIWKNPWMVVGGNNFIHHLFPFLSLKNIFESRERYPEISWEDPIWSKVDLILLSSEPYPFKEKHILEIQTYAPQAQILLVDGEMFSWYGSRLLQTPDYFKSLKESIIYS